MFGFSFAQFESTNSSVQQRSYLFTGPDAETIREMPAELRFGTPPQVLAHAKTAGSDIRCQEDEALLMSYIVPTIAKSTPKISEPPEVVPKIILRSILNRSSMQSDSSMLAFIGPFPLIFLYPQFAKATLRKDGTIDFSYVGPIHPGIPGEFDTVSKLLLDRRAK